jgi:hypothetical protein
MVQGCDCSITIKTAYREMGIPYSDETIREAVSIMQEEAAIEGDSVCRGLPTSNGVTGCVVTPLTIGSVPFLLHLAMGSTGSPVFVSETRNLYRQSLSLLPYEDGPRFDLIQKRGNGKWLYEGCGVMGFELRIMREEALKLKLDIAGEKPPVTYSYNEIAGTEIGERFNGNGVTYRINGKEYKNIYGVTLTAEKDEGTKTEIWIKRTLEDKSDLPHLIEELTITAQLYRETYEHRNFGMFRLSLSHVVLNTDETVINSADTVVGPLRYYVAGKTMAEVFSFGEGINS